jgi:hypothetical protein
VTAHHRKLKNAILEIDGVQFQVQAKASGLSNNTDDPEIFYVLVEGEEYSEEPDPSFSFTATFLADWRSGGVSDFLWLNDGRDLPFQLDLHPDIPAEHVRWNGVIHIKAPNVGGEARATEEQEVEFVCVGKPVYSRP